MKWLSVADAVVLVSNGLVRAAVGQDDLSDRPYGAEELLYMGLFGDKTLETNLIFPHRCRVLPPGGGIGLGLTPRTSGTT